MSKMSYALFKIVEKNGNSLECVAPTRWIKDSKVYWPKYATKQLALENAPMEPTWPAYDIAEIKKYHDDYNYLSKCCYSTTEDDSPIKKKPTEPKRTSSPQFVKLSSSYTNSFTKSLPGACGTQNLSPSIKRRRNENIVRSSYSPRAAEDSFIPLSSMINLTDDNFNPEDCIAPDLLNRPSETVSRASPTSLNCGNSKSAKHHIDFNSGSPNDLNPPKDLYSPNSSGTISRTINTPSRKPNHSNGKSAKHPSQSNLRSKYGDGGKSFKEMPNKQFQYSVMMEMQTIRRNQDRILQFLEDQQCTSDKTGFGTEVPEPLNTMAEFMKEEAELEGSERKRRAKRMIIQQAGGKCTRDAVRKALDVMMTRKLQSKFSKDGLQKKKKFTGTQHQKCMEAVLIRKHQKDEINRLLVDVIKRAVDKESEPSDQAACGIDNPANDNDSN